MRLLWGERDHVPWCSGRNIAPRRQASSPLSLVVYNSEAVLLVLACLKPLRFSVIELPAGLDFLQVFNLVAEAHVEFVVKIWWGYLVGSAKLPLVPNLHLVHKGRHGRRSSKSAGLFPWKSAAN